MKTKRLMIIYRNVEFLLEKYKGFKIYIAEGALNIDFTDSVVDKKEGSCKFLITVRELSSSVFVSVKEYKIDRHNNQCEFFYSTGDSVKNKDDLNGIVKMIEYYLDSYDLKLGDYTIFDFEGSV